MYRLTYEMGNEYECSCCRYTWKDTEDFDTYEDAIEQAIEVTATKLANGDDMKVLEMWTPTGAIDWESHSITDVPIQHSIQKRCEELGGEKKKRQASESMKYKSDHIRTLEHSISTEEILKIKDRIKALKTQLNTLKDSYKEQFNEDWQDENEL